MATKSVPYHSVPSYISVKWVVPPITASRLRVEPTSPSPAFNTEEELLVRLLAGEELYLRNDEQTYKEEQLVGRWQGSIGKLASLGCSYNRGESYKKITSVKDMPSFNWTMAKLKFTVGTSTVTKAFFLKDLIWVMNHTGPTLLCDYDDPRSVKPIMDRLGTKIKVGDFCSFVARNPSTNKLQTYFGKVTKIDKSGLIWCENIKLNDSDVIKERKVSDNSNIVVITNDLMDRIMIHRLSL